MLTTIYTIFSSEAVAKERRQEDHTILSTADFWTKLSLGKDRHYKQASPEPEIYQLLSDSPVSLRRIVMLNKNAFLLHGQYLRHRKAFIMPTFGM